MKLLPLTRGAHALVDDDDYERVSAFKWTLDSTGYAVRKATIQKKQQRILLHRFILDAQAGYDVDHIDGNPLNCQRSNLRIATRSQNSANRGPKPGSASRYKGVYRKKNRWYSTICVNGADHWLGSYLTEEAAALAYNQAAIQHFGEFAWLNPIGA